MIKRIRRRVRASQKDGPRTSSGASYTVGYGKPPREHRFQSGQSGNPKGRPKGAKNTDTLVREILDRKIDVRTGGTIRKISVREAMLTRFAEFALKGDMKPAAFLLYRYDMPKPASMRTPRDAGRSRNRRRVSEDTPRQKRSTEMTHREDSRRDPADALRVVSPTQSQDAQPGPDYLPNWHIRAITHQLERTRRGGITRLIINMPPRHLKSLTVSVAFPAFLLGHEPRRRIFAISYGSELSSKHASDFRSIVKSPWYQRAFPKMRISRSLEDEVWTTARGFRRIDISVRHLDGAGHAQLQDHRTCRARTLPRSRISWNGFGVVRPGGSSSICHHVI